MTPSVPPPVPPSRPATADLVAWDRQYLWHPFTPMKPWCESKEILIIERGEREFLFDTEGRRYIDAVSSLWCNVHGHNIPELNAALIAQLQQVAHTSLLGLANVPSTLLAKRLIELVHAAGLHLDKVFYSDNGSTAVEVACKMAYQYWRNLGHPGPGRTTTAAGGGPAKSGSTEPRSKFLAFSHAYHGDTLGAVSVGGIPIFHHAFKSLCFPVDFVPPPSSLDAGQKSLEALETALLQHPNAYAAIIIEPLVLGAGGMRMYPPSVLRQLRELADRYNTLLIFDEVLTGFGRTGKMFAAEHSADETWTPGTPSNSTPATARGPVSPDLLCLSKGLTAGYMPLGVTLASQKIFDAFYVDPNESDGKNAGKTFFHGHTFTGHPLACAVALASLDLFEKNHLLAHVHALAPILDDCLESAARLPGVANARRCGLIGALDLFDPSTGQAFPFHMRIGGEICSRMRTLGILARPLADTLVLMPPLAITPDNLRTLCDATLTALSWLPEILTRKHHP